MPEPAGMISAAEPTFTIAVSARPRRNFSTPITRKADHASRVLISAILPALHGADEELGPFPVRSFRNMVITEACGAPKRLFFDITGIRSFTRHLLAGRFITAQKGVPTPGPHEPLDEITTAVASFLACNIDLRTSFALHVIGPFLMPLSSTY